MYKNHLLYETGSDACLSFLISNPKLILSCHNTLTLNHFLVSDTLKRHHAMSAANKDIPPYLPIPHVRDMLIPLASRFGFVFS